MIKLTTSLRNELKTLLTGKSPEDNPFIGRLIFWGKIRIFKKIQSRHQSLGFYGASDHRGYFLSFLKTVNFKKELLKDKIFYENRDREPGGSFMYEEGFEGTS